MSLMAVRSERVDEYPSIPYHDFDSDDEKKDETAAAPVLAAKTAAATGWKSINAQYLLHPSLERTVTNLDFLNLVRETIEEDQPLGPMLDMRFDPNDMP